MAIGELFTYKFRLKGRITLPLQLSLNLNRNKRAIRYHNTAPPSTAHFLVALYTLNLLNEVASLRDVLRFLVDET